MSLIYYDDSGNIRGVSPIAVEWLAEFPVLEVAEDVALRFLRDEINMHDWYVFEIDGERRLFSAELILKNQQNGYRDITQSSHSGGFGLTVRYYTRSKTLTVSIPQIFTRKAPARRQAMKLYATVAGDPSDILDIIDVDVLSLFRQGEMRFYCNLPPQFMLFAPDLFYEYDFKIEDAIAGLRLDHVVKSRHYVSPNDRPGLLASYDAATGATVFEIVNGGGTCYEHVAHLMAVYVIHPLDPSFLIASVDIDVAALYEHGKVTVTLPPSLNDSFTMTSYPLFENLMVRCLPCL